MKKKVTAVLVTSILLSLGSTVLAAEKTPEQLELEALKLRVEQLEKLLSKNETNLSKLEEKQTKSEEKIKTDKSKEFQFGGDARIRYINQGNGTQADQRFRLTIQKEIDKDVTFFSRLLVMNNNKFGTTGEKDFPNLVSNASIHMKNFLGQEDLEFAAGRVGQTFGANGYFIAESTGRMDGFKFTRTTDKLKATIGYANFAAQSGKGVTTANSSGKVTTTPSPKLEEAIFANVQYDVSKATTLYAMYIREKTGTENVMDFDWRGIGIKTAFAKNLRFMADYTRNYAIDGNPSGLYTSLRFRQYNYNKPKSFEWRIDYRDIKAGNMTETGLGDVPFPQKGFKGFGIGLHYVIAKNTRLNLYQSFNTKDADTGESKDDYSRAEIVIKL